MKVIIANADTEKIYLQIADATAAQVAAYTGSNLIELNDQEVSVNTIVMNSQNDTLMVLVDADDEE